MPAFLHVPPSTHDDLARAISDDHPKINTPQSLIKHVLDDPELMFKYIKNLETWRDIYRSENSSKALLEAQLELLREGNYAARAAERREKAKWGSAVLMFLLGVFGIGVALVGGYFKRGECDAFVGEQKISRG
jgi:hypothetical protein